MKLYHIITMVLLAAVAIASLIIADAQHTIASPPKENGECTYEGAECPNVQNYLRDYQIYLHDDTVKVYDTDRLVGTYINTRWDSQLDSILIKDNL